MLQIIATPEECASSCDSWNHNAFPRSGIHGSHLPSSLPLYKLHDDVTWFNLNTWGRKWRVVTGTCVGIRHACSCVHCHYLYLKRPLVSDYVTITLLLTHTIVRNLKRSPAHLLSDIIKQNYFLNEILVRINAAITKIIVIIVRKQIYLLKCKFFFNFTFFYIYFL